MVKKQIKFGFRHLSAMENMPHTRVDEGKHGLLFYLFPAQLYNWIKFYNAPILPVSDHALLV